MTLTNLGYFYKHCDDYANALKYASEAYNLYKENYDVDHELTLSALYNLATIYGDGLYLYPQAISLLNDVKRLAIERYGNDHILAQKAEKAIREYEDIKNE